MADFNIWAGVAVFCTGWFIVQFLLSVIFGLDSDTDINVNDLDVSDFISFKGVIHFGIGYSWWMVTHAGNTTWATHAIAFLLGVLVMVILWLTYLGISKLKKEVVPELGEALVGKTCEIYTKNPYTGEYTILIEANGALKEVSGVRTKDMNLVAGQRAVIKEYVDGKYYIY